MKKLFYLIVVLGVLALIVAGCTTSVVPPVEQNVTNGLTKGSTIYVDDDWQTGVPPYPEDTDLDNDFATIQAAITAASDGDIIIVAAGTYTNDLEDPLLPMPERYRITKSITLLGAQAGNDPLGSIDRGNESILVKTNGLPYSIMAPNVVIDGFMNGDPLIVNSGGRFMIGDDADNAIIMNCIIQNTPIGSSGHGVYIYSGADNALVEYNTFYDTAWEAVASWKVSGAVITHNYISKSGQHAIQMMGHAGTDNEISYNHISGIADKNAIQYWGGPGAIIIHNVIDGGDTMYDGIWLDEAADGSIVSNNQISDTIYAGINVRGGCTGATVTYNELSGCGTGIETHVGATGASVNYNNIEGNSWGVRNYDTEILNATHNWWGDVTGPCRELPNGKWVGGGDKVSSNVDYRPWLPHSVEFSNDLPSIICTTIQDGILLTSDSEVITIGFDDWGYNYQAHLFNGFYCDSYRDADWCQEYKDVNLAMKWNDAWISNKDCDGDGLLDRHFGYDSYIGSGAWLTNHQSGEYEGENGEVCKWNYFVKIVAAPSDAYVDSGYWYDAGGTEIGPVIWGAFAIVQQVENDACAGLHGLQYLSPSGPGFGQYGPE